MRTCPNGFGRRGWELGGSRFSKRNSLWMTEFHMDLGPKILTHRTGEEELIWWIKKKQICIMTTTVSFITHHIPLKYHFERDSWESTFASSPLSSSSMIGDWPANGRAPCSRQREGGGGKCAAAGAMVHLVRSGTYLPPALIVIYRPLTSAPILFSMSVWGSGGRGATHTTFATNALKYFSSSKDLCMRSIAGCGWDLAEYS